MVWGGEKWKLLVKNPVGFFLREVENGVSFQETLGKANQILS